MFAAANIIERQAGAWAREQLASASSLPGAILRHSAAAGKLREPQLRAVESYLWLKFEGGGKPLGDIIAEGKLTSRHLAREYGYAAYWNPCCPVRHFFMAFARGNKLRALAEKAREDAGHDWRADLDKLPGMFSYPNRTFSLPMGAGKTYLMAAFICLDLHFSRLLPGDARFAHNFVVLAPHAAKTAILPSLKTIKNFNPHWLLPPAAAKDTMREMRVEVLDQSSAAKGSMRVNNPNLEKVNRLSQMHERGLVFVTNAEKVVLERPTEREQWNVSMRLKKAEEAVRHNALRDRLAELPHLSVFLDEVHHAESEDKKLRMAVDILNAKKNLREVVGFSGTPYTSAVADICGVRVRFKQMQDTVYHFPLARGIGTFLKTPKTLNLQDVREASFVEEALDAFFGGFDAAYEDGTKSKMAFYCPSIRALNEEVLPAVQKWYRAKRPGGEHEILSYYAKGGKAYPLPSGALADFHRLDSAHSEKRIILLVAVGREGWDCRSLAAVAIPRKRATRNFVLQTSCRCLREVANAADESALICLGDGNYELLKEQLMQRHGISVDAFQKGERDTLPVLPRKPQLGKLRFKQVSRRWKLESQSAAAASPKPQLQKYRLSGFMKANDYEVAKTKGVITPKGNIGGEIVTVKTTEAQEKAQAGFLSPVETYGGFLVELQRALWGRLTAAALSQQYGDELSRIHNEFAGNHKWFAAHPAGGEEATMAALKEVAALFAEAQQYRSEEILADVHIELLEWRKNSVINYGGGNFLPEVEREKAHRYHLRPSRFDDDLEDDKTDPHDISFSYAPYRLDSNLEREVLLRMLKEEVLADFEVYYNGHVQEGLQSFHIITPDGKYTPDFLLLRRRGGKPYRKGDESAAAIERVLIIETKGAPFDNDDFRAKERFVKECFIRHNRKFEYVCFRGDDASDINEHLRNLRERVREWQNQGDKQ